MWAEVSGPRRESGRVERVRLPGEMVLVRFELTVDRRGMEDCSRGNRQRDLGSMKGVVDINI